MNDADKQVRDLCAFLGIAFQDSMLAIPQVGSSNEADKPDSFGIKTERAGNWEKGGLNKGEVWFCQRICRAYMLSYGYSVKPVNPVFLSGLVLHFLPVQNYVGLVIQFASNEEHR